MALIQRKGLKGAAANYITRTRAVRKLQISLADFRKLCILKGIYPREPKSKKKAASGGITKAKYKDGAGKGNRGANANNTFYYVKDIQFLLHEPVLAKLRERHAFEKKIAKVVAKRDYHAAENMQEPTYTLDHLVKERYPTFNDALMDLDDCLCHLFLFATLPTDYASSDGSALTSESKIMKCQRLCNEFLTYVIRSGSLEKVFCSIKGYYYRARINGVEVTWLVPHQFTYTSMTSEMKNLGTVGGINGGVGVADVDMRVMLTFLEFYECMLSFVNFKLLASVGIAYPPGPQVLHWTADEDETLEEESEVQVGQSKRQMKQKIRQLNEKLPEIANQQQSVEVSNADEEVEELDIIQEDQKSQLFTGLTVKLNREVPRHSLQFILLAHGATVILPSYTNESSDTAVTHEVCDRPLESVSMKADRKYVQPQWVFDCVNKGQLIQEDLYALGTQLPPHLSPFEEYIVEEEPQPMEVSEDEEAAAEVPKATMTKEQREMAKMMMSNKKRKFLERIEKSQMHQEAEKSKLKAKRHLLRQPVENK